MVLACGECTPMLSWLFLGLSLHLNNGLAANERHTGVNPSLISKYTPLSGDLASWRCLDGSKIIPWSSVNDDYCDCADGSDEPGTSACPNSTFYCHNEGHIGATIQSSRVNDGLCEPECCDGSDEQPAVCPNACEEVGKEYRTKLEAEMKVRKTGSKIRSTYVSFANKEQKRLEDLVVKSSNDVDAQEKEVAKLRDILERTESTSAAELERRKESPLYKSLLAHSGALKALKRQHEDLVSREKTLADILSSLRAGYNPNYQDMAVLEAVRGYEFYAGLPSINDRDRKEGEDAASDEEGEESAEEKEEELEEGEWTKEQLDKDLGPMLYTDYDSLLLEHDQMIGSDSTQSLLFDIESYIPESLLPQYEIWRDYIVSILETIGMARRVEEPSTDTSKARTAFQKAENALANILREKEDAERELTRLFDTQWFGPEGEWKKLDGTCLSKDTGDYTYEVCLFGEARQKPNKGGSTFSLGKFSSWNSGNGITEGSPEYYSKQHYTKGARCWNGPERSVTVAFSCGTDNALLSIAEPEKCEYLLTGTSPALCLPLGVDKSNGRKAKDEL